MRMGCNQLMEISVTIRTDLVQLVPTNIVYNSKQQARSPSATSSRRHPNAIPMGLAWHDMPPPQLHTTVYYKEKQILVDSFRHFA